MAFVDEALPEELKWATMVLILEGRGGYRGIGIFELTWKVCTVVVNFCLKQSVELHDVINGFM